MDTEIKNAKIAKVSIGVEDHGILTMWLHIEGAGWGVGFGGYALDQYDPIAKRRVGHPMLAEAIIRLLGVFKVDDVRKLEGLPCRTDGEGWGGRMHRIGHFMEDRWFSFQELADELKSKEPAAQR